MDTTRDVFETFTERIVIPGINSPRNPNVKFDTEFEGILDRIMIERVAGSLGSIEVQEVSGQVRSDWFKWSKLNLAIR